MVDRVKSLFDKNKGIPIPQGNLNNNNPPQKFENRSPGWGRGQSFQPGINMYAPPRQVAPQLNQTQPNKFENGYYNNVNRPGNNNIIPTQMNGLRHSFPNMTNTPMALINQ